MITLSERLVADERQRCPPSEQLEPKIPARLAATKTVGMPPVTSEPHIDPRVLSDQGSSLSLVPPPDGRGCAQGHCTIVQPRPHHDARARLRVLRTDRVPRRGFLCEPLGMRRYDPGHVKRVYRRQATPRGHALCASRTRFVRGAAHAFRTPASWRFSVSSGSVSAPSGCRAPIKRKRRRSRHRACRN